MDFKLGKNPPVHDARTLMFGAYLKPQLPPPPPAVDYGKKVPLWPMYGNDIYGDCTCAAAGHMIQCWTANAAAELSPANNSVIHFYEHFVGTPPPPDAGCDMLTVLRYWRKTGLANHKVLAFTGLTLGDATQAKQALDMFGGLYIGLSMPLTAQDQDVWDWTGSLTGPARPGSWGGHAVDVVGYSDAGLEVVTWGALKLMTWAFWRRYCDEAYCILSPDFLQAGKAPNGFDLAALKADLELVTA